MKLKIITHERIVFDSDVDELVIQTTSGQMGILKDHIPLTTALAIGVTKARMGETYKYFATMEYSSLRITVQQFLLMSARTAAILMLHVQMQLKTEQKQD